MRSVARTQNVERGLLNTVASLAVGLALVAIRLAAQQPNGYDLLQQALAKERAAGKLDEAIAMYQRIAHEHAANHPLAAKALLQLGRCYEKLGRAEARKTYEQILREYGDQKDAVADARARLAELAPARTQAGGPFARRVWAGPGVDLEGAPSPDGRYLTYVDWDTGDVAVRDLTTGANRRLTKNPPFLKANGFASTSRPSPDGKSVAYAWFNNARGGYELRVIGIDGTAERVVFSRATEHVLNLAWMPDGRHIAIGYERADRTHQLAIVTIADGSLQPLRTFDWRTFAAISVSPNGRYLAYDFPPREDSPSRDLFVVATDGSFAAPLVEHAANDIYPSWTPDGRHVVFVSDRTGGPNLWVVPVADGRPAGPPRLLQSSGNLLPLGFTRTGAFYYGLKTASTDVYVATLSDDASRLVDQPHQAAPRLVGSNQRPDWSFDARFLAYQSDRVAGGGIGSRVISILSLEKGTEREISPDLSYFQRPRWSPDGRRLLVNGTSTNGRSGLYAVDAQSGSTELLVPRERDGASYGQAWSPDGSTIFYTASDTAGDARGQVIAGKHLRSGELKPIYRAPAGRTVGEASPAPDGRWLAFREGNDPTALKIVPIDGGQARDVIVVPHPDSMPGFGGINWTRDARHLLFVRTRGTTDDAMRELWRVGIDTGEAVKVGLTMRGLRDVTLHPDGRQIAFTAVDGNDEVWVLEHALPPRASDRSAPRTSRPAGLKARPTTVFPTRPHP